MPITDIPLDEVVRKENGIILHGKNRLLKVVEDYDVKQFLSQKDLHELLSTRDICGKGFREIMDELIETEWQGGTGLERASGRSWSTRRLLKSKMTRERGVGRKIVGELESSIQKLQKLPGLEQKIKRFNKNLRVLDPVVLVSCPKCRIPINVKEGSEELSSKRDEIRFWVPFFRSSKLHVLKGELRRSVRCEFCGNIVTKANAKRTNLPTIKRNIRLCWESGLWLEEYFSRLLTDLGWRTWPHVQVQGSSGVRYEVDVLGVKGSSILVCQCKSGSVSNQFLSNFSTKIYDIRPQVSILASTERLPKSAMRETVAKDPSMILLEKIGEKGKKHIMNQLRSRILGKI
ncbi:MAG: hypothetical protein ACLPY5_03375 [Candidatus Bathyarchaeia archaeon]